MEKHMTAGVIILTQEAPTRVLLVHHKKFDKWMSPGGHVEQRENPYEAAIREVKEETGLDIAPYLSEPSRMDDMVTMLPIPYRILEERIPEYGDTPEHFHIDHVYTACIPFQEATHDIAESKAIRWATQEELEGLEMFEDFRMLMREIFRGDL